VAQAHGVPKLQRTVARAGFWKASTLTTSAGRGFDIIWPVKEMFTTTSA